MVKSIKQNVLRKLFLDFTVCHLFSFLLMAIGSVVSGTLATVILDCMLSLLCCLDSIWPVLAQGVKAPNGVGPVG